MSLALGPFQLDQVSDGFIRLDGGAMFGVVPKALWEKHLPADAQNRIRLAERCLLVRDRTRTVLVDDGMGSKWSPKQRTQYGVEQDQIDLDRDLARLGVARDQVTDVILTHLHFDHAGGTTRRGAMGELELAFPNATHHVQRRNWEWARQPNDRERASYLAENFELLERSSRLHLLDGAGELFPGIELLLSEGHTTALQLVKIRAGGQTLLYCADLVPTRFHLRPAWGMGYDLRPLTLIEEKKQLLAQALQEGWILFFEHDPALAACRLRTQDGQAAFGEAVAL